jgi:hypothetical protein
VIRTEIRKAAVGRRTSVPSSTFAGVTRLKPAERDLLASLLEDPARALRAVFEMEDADFEGLASAAILRQARELASQPAPSVPGLLLQRLSDHEAQVLTGLAARGVAVAAPAECARALRVLRYERERAALQREIDRLQEQAPDRVDEMHALWARKRDLLVRIEALNG